MTDGTPHLFEPSAYPSNPRLCARCGHTLTNEVHLVHPEQRQSATPPVPDAQVAEALAAQEQRYDPALDTAEGFRAAVLLAAQERKPFTVAGVTFVPSLPEPRPDGTEVMFTTPLEKLVLTAMRIPSPDQFDTTVVLTWIRATVALLTKPSGADLLREVARQTTTDEEHR